MDLEKKDWENIKKEADAQIKQATLMLTINNEMARIAQDNINRMAYAKSSANQHKTTD